METDMSQPYYIAVRKSDGKFISSPYGDICSEYPDACQFSSGRRAMYAIRDGEHEASDFNIITTDAYQNGDFS
jgi:hypothetical protein